MSATPHPIARPAARLTRARVIYGYFSKDVRKRRARLLGGIGFAVFLAWLRGVSPLELVSPRLDRIVLNFFRKRTALCHACERPCNEVCDTCKKPATRTQY